MEIANTLLVSTRKGLMIYQSTQDGWQQTACHFKAIPVTLSFEDSRTGHWFACLDHGHWGVKLHRSTDKGQSWDELKSPLYPTGYKVNEDVEAKTEYIWAMSEGGVGHPNRLWMGTIPGGLFVSEDNGDSWILNESLWHHPSRKKDWFGAGFDHPGIHSIIVDPRDSDHITVGISVAGVFETTDGGQTWHPRNKGLRAEFLPDAHAEVGHDPHILVSTKSHPDLLWQQNHCGIFKSSDRSATWQEVGQKGGPAHFGFGMALDEENPEVAWVAPAIADEYRIAVDEALCICRTDDGGASWKELRTGLPQSNCYDIVYRHALTSHGDQVVFGTTTGNLFFSNNRGDNWQNLSHFLPMVYAVAFGNL